MALVSQRLQASASAPQSEQKAWKATFAFGAEAIEDQERDILVVGCLIAGGSVMIVETLVRSNLQV
jgi:hypothetical protein